jgi:hypothetical protein
MSSQALTKVFSNQTSNQLSKWLRSKLLVPVEREAGSTYWYDVSVTEYEQLLSKLNDEEGQ